MDILYFYIYWISDYFELHYSVIIVNVKYFCYKHFYILYNTCEESVELKTGRNSPTFIKLNQLIGGGGL